MKKEHPTAAVAFVAEPQARDSDAFEPLSVFHGEKCSLIRVFIGAAYFAMPITDSS